MRAAGSMRAAGDCAYADSGRNSRQGVHQRVRCGYSEFSPVRSGRGARWFALVHRPAGEQAGTARSADRTVQGMSCEDSGFGTHGLVADREGNIWFTAIAKGYVGKLDPKTGEVMEYHMPGWSGGRSAYSGF
jgi:streptogramin lyase